MIYLDTSVALAHLLSESRCPPDSFWSEALVTSRLLSYQAWTRINAMGLADSHGDLLRELFAHVMFLELTPPALARALAPFPVPVRTLDALHLASIDHLASGGRAVALATYDERLASAARSMGIKRYKL